MADPTPPFYLPQKWENVTAGLSGFAVYMVFWFLGDPGRGIVGGAFFASIVMSLRTCWPLRRESWYRFAMALLTIVHIAILVIFSWSAAAEWTSLAVIPLMTVDVALILGTIYLLYRSKYGRPDELFIETGADYHIKDLDI